MDTPPSGSSRCRVLLTDDDAFVRTVYTDALRGRGCDVTEARGGQECITLARSLKPDLVLMDLSMPGMDGWQALTALRADPQTRGLRVIALTASTTIEMRERALAAGFDAFISKPFTPQVLLRELESAWQQFHPPTPDPFSGHSLSTPFLVPVY